MDIKTVGVIGCGTMGSGICEVSARARYKVIFTEINEEHIEGGIVRIEHSIGPAPWAGPRSSK